MTKGGGLKRKVTLAISEAEDDEYADSVVVLVDRDKPEFRSRLADMEKALVIMAGKAITARTVVGMAIEEMEAWLIADHNLLTGVFSATKGISNPESRPDPKSDFHGVLDNAGITHAEGYDMAANQLELKVVESKCKAFQNFAKDVRQKLG